MTRDEQALATRRKLLDVAIALLSEGGYAALTSSGVSARAGLTRGAFQHHFPNRLALVRAVVDETTAELMELPVANLGETIRERISAVVDRYWDYFRSTYYTAMIQLTLGNLKDVAVRRWVAAEVNRSQAVLDDKWLDAFSATGASRQQVRSARLLVLATLRGFVMLGHHRYEETDWTREVALLKEMLFVALTTDVTNRPPVPAPKRRVHR
jgi:AcrR family transcriptional regulator